MLSHIGSGPGIYPKIGVPVPNGIGFFLVTLDGIGEMFAKFQLHAIFCRCQTVFAQIPVKTARIMINPFSANFTEWSNTFKQFVGTNCLSVFDHFVGLALKGLRNILF